MNFEARRVNGNTFDIFFGAQWADWMRVKVGRNGAYRVDGVKVDHATMREVRYVVTADMPITYGQSQQTTLANCIAINQR